MNQQKWHFTVIQNKEIFARITEMCIRDSRGSTFEDAQGLSVPCSKRSECFGR